ncbi:MAG: TIGR04282 family arsenosugar biosynthesis glycosyltransferase [Xenococcaceae cyanobacterium]
MSETLIIFTRYPEPGKTKTRMIPALGAEGAAKLQRKLTEHTLQQAKVLRSSRSVFLEVHYAGGNQQLMEQWLGDNLTYYPQQQGDLGQRMCSAFARAFAAGNERVVIIGTDCPDLNELLLNRAFELLKQKDLVLGVAEDGGYYLVGLSRLICELFVGISWGSDRVLAQTKNIADRLGLNTDYLPPLNDIDRPEDLSIWEKYDRQAK